MNVRIKLRTRNIFDVESRLIEVEEIREWIRELVEWDDDKFSIKFSHEGCVMVVWFDDPEHAIMCKLRWS